MKSLFCPGMTDACIGAFDYLSISFLLAPAVFVLSLAAYFLNEKHISFWIKGTSVFSAFYFLIIFLVPKDYGVGIMNVFPDERVTTLILTIVFYFLVSVVYFLGVATNDFRNKK